MTQGPAISSDAVVDTPLGFEEQARLAARGKFAEWNRLEREQRPKRILYFCIAAAVIIFIAVLLIHARRLRRKNAGMAGYATKFTLQVIRLGAEF